jgi:lipid-A-disaccharide synthase
MRQSHQDVARPRRILIVAAEASSALYAQRLLELWQKNGERVEAFGIGSRKMEELGFEILGRSEELAVVGIQEVLSHWGLIKQTFYKLIEVAQKRRPDVVLLLDYPDFNFRLAKRIKSLNLPVVYYISPQIWAWRQGRVKIMKKWVDKVLVLFPFEKKFYEQHHVVCDFVGHPLLDELNEDLLNPKSIQSRREKYGLNPRQPIVALMPGSRHSELKAHLQTQLDVAHRLYRRDPHRQFVLIVAPTFSKEEIKQKLPNLDFPLQLIQGESFEMISLADVVLTASGTATLIVGLMEKPMVIMYKMSAFTAFLAKRIVTHTPFFGMINLILNEKVVPELFQEQASSENLTKEVEAFLNDESLRHRTIERLKQAKTALGDRGATQRVHQALREYFN